MDVLKVANATRNAIKAWRAADALLAAARDIDPYINVEARDAMFRAHTLAHDAAKRFTATAYESVDPLYIAPCEEHPHGLLTWGCQTAIYRIDAIIDKARYS